MARSRTNPFWVTPQGTAVHHTDAQFSAYKKLHPTRILPAQAAREADIEGAYADGRDAAPGTSIRPAHVDIKGKRTIIYRVFIGKKDSGKYGMDRRKAVEISHKLGATARANRAKNNGVYVIPEGSAHDRAVETAFDRAYGNPRPQRTSAQNRGDVKEVHDLMQEGFSRAEAWDLVRQQWAAEEQPSNYNEAMAKEYGRDNRAYGNPDMWGKKYRARVECPNCGSAIAWGIGTGLTSGPARCLDGQEHVGRSGRVVPAHDHHRCGWTGAVRWAGTPSERVLEVVPESAKSNPHHRSSPEDIPGSYWTMLDNMERVLGPYAVYIQRARTELEWAHKAHRAGNYLVAVQALLNGDSALSGASGKFPATHVSYQRGLDILRSTMRSMATQLANEHAMGKTYLGLRNNPHHRSSPAVLARAQALNAATSFRQSGGLRNIQMLGQADRISRQYDADQIANSGYVPYKAALQQAYDVSSAYSLDHTDANRSSMLDHARVLNATYDLRKNPRGVRGTVAKKKVSTLRCAYCGAPAAETLRIMYGPEKGKDVAVCYNCSGASKPPFIPKSVRSRLQAEQEDFARHLVGKMRKHTAGRSNPHHRSSPAVLARAQALNRRARAKNNGIGIPCKKTHQPETVKEIKAELAYLMKNYNDWSTREGWAIRPGGLRRRREELEALLKQAKATEKTATKNNPKNTFKAGLRKRVLRDTKKRKEQEEYDEQQSQFAYRGAKCQQHFEDEGKSAPEARAREVAYEKYMSAWRRGEDMRGVDNPHHRSSPAVPERVTFGGGWIQEEPGGRWLYFDGVNKWSAESEVAAREAVAERLTYDIRQRDPARWTYDEALRHARAVCGLRKNPAGMAKEYGRDNPHHRSSPAVLARAQALNAATSFRQRGGLRNVKLLSRARSLERGYNDEEIQNSGYVPYKTALRRARDAESAYNLDHADANRPELLEHARQLAAAYDDDEIANSGYVPHKAALQRAYDVSSAYNADRFDTTRSGMLDYARQLGATYDAEDNPGQRKLRTSTSKKTKKARRY